MCTRVSTQLPAARRSALPPLRGLHLLSPVTITQQPGPEGKALIAHGSPPHRRTERVCVKDRDSVPRGRPTTVNSVSANLRAACVQAVSCLDPSLSPVLSAPFPSTWWDSPLFQILTLHCPLDRHLPSAAGLPCLSLRLLGPGSDFPSDPPLLGPSSAPGRPSLAHHPPAAQKPRRAETRALRLPARAVPF